MTATAPPKPFAPWDPRRALSRTSLALAVAFLTGGALSAGYSAPVAILGGWDAGGLVLLTLAWLVVTSCDPARTRLRAGSEDPGRTTVYVLVLLTSFVSLFAATILARRAKSIAAAEEGPVLIGLCLLTVALSWALTHTSFTLRYAHLYYRADREGVGGVEFPGAAPPSYFDFAYFAFTIGMCFQVSDCTVSSPQIRRAVLVHAVMSYAYTTVIVAFALNLVFGAMG